jgi:hypothetical protein
MTNRSAVRVFPQPGSRGQNQVLKFSDHLDHIVIYIRDVGQEVRFRKQRYAARIRNSWGESLPGPGHSSSGGVGGHCSGAGQDPDPSASSAGAVGNCLFSYVSQFRTIENKATRIDGPPSFEPLPELIQPVGRARVQKGLSDGAGHVRKPRVIVLAR